MGRLQPIWILKDEQENSSLARKREGAGMRKAQKPRT